MDSSKQFKKNTTLTKKSGQKVQKKVKSVQERMPPAGFEDMIIPETVGDINPEGFKLSKRFTFIKMLYGKRPHS